MRWRLFISFLLAAFIPISVFLFIGVSSINQYYTTQIETELRYQANKLSGTIRMANYMGAQSKRPILENDIYIESRATGYRIIVVDSMAVVVVDSNRTETGKTFAIPEIIEALGKKDVARLQKGGQTVYAAVSILNDDAEVTGAVLIIAPADDITAIWRELGSTFVMLMLTLCGIVTVLVLFLSQLIINPLKGIVNTVRKITEGHLDERVTPSGSEEFVELANAFNDMTNKLRQTETTRQEFVSNVSHELKTPLSSMKVLSDTLLLTNDVSVETHREFLQDINSEIDRMTAIINELLALVRLDRSENPLIIQQVKINKLVENLLKRLYPLAEQKNIEFLYQDVKVVIIDADEMKLGLALSNLIENAIKYTDIGGTVKIIVDADSQNAFITVQDNGIGIAEEEHTKVFTRFYRVDKTRDRDTGGTGLGLAITHKTVLLHNGSIKLNSKEGEGSSFVVRLPIHRRMPNPSGTRPD